jgi:FdhD protein
MSTTKVEHVVRWENGGSRIDADELAQEEPLEIRVRGRGISVTMRTPGHDDALAAGFLLTEGIIHHSGDLLKIENCDRNEFGNVINVQLSPEVPVDFDRLTRHVFASSSCGLCGKATIDAIQNRFPTLAEPSLPQIDAEQVAKMPDLMRQSQSIFDRTGGLHAAGLFDLSGKLLVLHEDIGRHNAVDKVLGHALLDGLHPLTHHVLLVSGRISFEIMQKALAARVPIVAAVSAPTNLAVHFAQESGQTLIAFLRGKRMNIYTFPDRILRA